MMTTKLIVGLGNVGHEYDNTRHNVGFKVVDALADKLGIDLNQNIFNGQYGVKIIGDHKIILAKPHTYMNLSGEFVYSFISYFKIKIEDLIIVYDDLNINLGDFRLKTTGSSGGQKGMRNIIEKLLTEHINRVKVGIGPRDIKVDLPTFVLAKFNKNDLSILDGVINKIVKMLIHVSDVEFCNLGHFL